VSDCESCVSDNSSTAAGDHMAVEDMSRYKKLRSKKSTAAAAAAGSTALSSAVPAAVSATDDTMSVTGYAIH